MRKVLIIFILAGLFGSAAVRGDAVYDRQQGVLNTMFQTLHADSTNSKVLAMRAYSAMTLRQRDPAAVAQADLDRANELLILIESDYPDDPNTYWIMPLVAQIAADADYRQYLSSTAMMACKDLLFGYHQSFFTVDDAGVNSAAIWHLTGSDNHDIMRKTTAYLTAQFLKSVPAYAGLQYADGHSPAEHYEAWTQFFRAYFRERARTGLQVEFASTTYTGVQLYPIVALYDSAESENVRMQAGRFLDLYFADAAAECVNGIRGGAKTRVGKYLYGGVNKFEVYGWILSGLPDSVAVSIPFEGYPGLATTYRLPSVVEFLFTQPQARGRYEYVSTRPGRGTHEEIGEELWYHVVFPSSIRRVTYTTPSYVMGTFTADESLAYTLIHSQNQWMGLNAADHVDSMIYFTTDEANNSGKNHYDLQAVQSENAAILRFNNQIMYDGGFKVFMSAHWSQERDNSGWLFGMNSDASVYYALFATDADLWGTRYNIVSAFPESDGTWVEFVNKNTLAVFEVGLAQDHADFTAFQDDIKDNAKTWNTPNEFEYQACSGTVLTFYRDETLPKIDGVTADLNPDKTYDCPYITAPAGSDVIEIADGQGNQLILDFSYCAGHYATDLNRDCHVNLYDFALMAGQWLECTQPWQAGCVMGQ